MYRTLTITRKGIFSGEVSNPDAANPYGWWDASKNYIRLGRLEKRTPLFLDEAEDIAFTRKKNLPDHAPVTLVDMLKAYVATLHWSEQAEIIERYGRLVSRTHGK